MTPSVQSVHGLRPQKPRDYSHMHVNIVHHVMTQYSLKKVLQKFRGKAEDAVSKELLQLHMKDTFAPQVGEELSEERRKGALELLMFLKEKLDRTIKGRACAEGRKQREGSTKSDTTSPTVSLEAVLTTSTIDAFEGRDVAIVDVPGAFLTANMDEEVLLCLRGKIAELMVKTAPEIYRKYVYIGPDNKPVLYVKLLKALNMCLRSALLFYKKLFGDLEGKGFTLNPYDPCVANKMVTGNQLTVTWHVDDLKLSHVNENEVTKTMNWLKSIYGEDMRVARGKQHDYIRTDLDFTVKVLIQVTMVPFFKGVITDLPEEITGTATSLVAAHLFDVRREKDRVLLEEDRSIALHHTVVQLLFACPRARKKIQ
jgi:hypothetical protein